MSDYKKDQFKIEVLQLISKYKHAQANPSDEDM